MSGLWSWLCRCCDSTSQEDEQSSVPVVVTEATSLMRDQLEILEKQLQIERLRVKDMERDLKEKERALQSVQQRVSELERANEQKDEELASKNQEFTKMKTFYNRKLKEERVSELERANEQKDEELASKNQEFTKMETLYKRKLEEERSAKKKKEEELMSLKDRLAADVSLSIKTGNTESLNSPVSKSRLTETYNELKLLQWPKIKDQLRSCQMKPKETEALIQKTFREAAEEMQKKKEQIVEVVGLLKPSSGLPPQKIQEYKQLAIQNHQMLLYKSNKDDLVKTHLSELGSKYSEEVLENLRPLVSQCYWLGCLLALNTSALQPDWENHTGSMDPWDMFPRNIRAASAM
ncbi:uncharacterized protein KZ484_014852 isoform 2-T2 [Pholidichthys leucotaenia]